MDFRLRPYVPTDTQALVQLFTDTVHAINRRDYSQQQCAAWAPHAYDLARWQSRFGQKQPLVAEQDGIIVAFGELEPDGHIDAFYVHASYQGQGIATQLLDALEQQAHARQLVRLYAEVSITALPFFQHHGFQIIAEQTVTVRGVAMLNYRMERRASRPTSLPRPNS